jgi:hypothetical protein
VAQVIQFHQDPTVVIVYAVLCKDDIVRNIDTRVGWLSILQNKTRSQLLPTAVARVLLPSAGKARRGLFEHAK